MERNIPCFHHNCNSNNSKNTILHKEQLEKCALGQVNNQWLWCILGTIFDSVLIVFQVTFSSGLDPWMTCSYIKIVDLWATFTFIKIIYLWVSFTSIQKDDLRVTFRLVLFLDFHATINFSLIVDLRVTISIALMVDLQMTSLGEGYLQGVVNVLIKHLFSLGFGLFYIYTKRGE